MLCDNESAVGENLGCVHAVELHAYELLSQNSTYDRNDVALHQNQDLVSLRL